MGTWVGSTANVDGLDITYEFTFRSDHTLEIDDTVIHPLSSLEFPGCTQQDQAIGYTWTVTSTDGGPPVLTIDQSQAEQATAYSHCMNATDDEAIPAMPNNCVISPQPCTATAVSFTYDIMGTMMTLTSVGTGIGTLVLARR